MPVSAPSELPVLVVDDEDAIIDGISNLLGASGIGPILACSDSREVLPLLARQEVEVVLLDLAMPHIRGEELLEGIRIDHPEIPVIIVTASEELDTAVRCMKQGAFDYMVKAVEPSRLVSGVKRAVEIRRLERRYSNLKAHLLSDAISHREAFDSIITASPRMEAIFRFVESIAPTKETVLVSGETGTGKELIAEALHKVSGRTGPLVKVNSAGLDDSVFADSLFGHVRGAYTGADSVRKGLVQQADEGTLFLDEIGDLSAASQIKLLRLLEAREYYPLGSDIAHSTSVRFIVATNRDLSRRVASGDFRRDLYYRLQTHEIRLPPLRERKEDLPLLLDHFLEDAGRDLARKRLAIPRELFTLLDTYDFPGNIRELRSMVYTAVSVQKEKSLSLRPFREAMGRADSGPPICEDLPNPSFPERLPNLREATESLIDEAMRRSRGNQTIAAGLLGITPQALSKRLGRRRRAGSWKGEPEGG